LTELSDRLIIWREETGIKTKAYIFKLSYWTIKPRRGDLGEKQFVYLKESVRCSVLAVLNLRCFLDIPLEMSVRQSDKWNLEILGGVWRRQWHPTPVLLPGKSHGQRSLVGCSPWGLEESDTTERLHFHFAVYGVAQSRTLLKRLCGSSSSSSREKLI